jgi:hypothetical protein
MHFSNKRCQLETSHCSLDLEIMCSSMKLDRRPVFLGAVFR